MGIISVGRNTYGLVEANNCNAAAFHCELPERWKAIHLYPDYTQFPNEFFAL
jgi:hypothetical protein